MLSVAKHINHKVTYQFFIVFIIIGFICIWNAFPINAIPSAAHDDALFMRGAENILNGQWLGPYDNRTLVKGPLLSIIPAFGASIGIWEKTVEGFIYALMLLVSVSCTRRFGMTRSLGLLMILLLVANPHIWSFCAGRRFLREVLYASLAISLLMLMLLGVSSRMKSRARISLWLVIGFIAGGMYLTREEDIWMISTMAVVLGLVGIRAIILLGLKGLISYWRDIGLACASIFFGIALSVTPVLFLNHSAYGRAIVSEFRAPEFRAAIGALMRVGDQHPSGYVPVSKASMNSIFANVPVAKSLSEHWPALSRGWSKHGAYLLDEDEEEIAGGWFVWAFRDAVAAAGHHHSAQSARQFYERLALEVNDACDSHTLNCRSPRDTLAPELKMDRISLFLKAIKNSLLYTATLSSPPIILPRSEGDTDQLLRWARLIGPVVVTSGVKVSGWIAHADSEPIITFGSDVHQKGREIEIFKKNEVVAALEKQGIQMSQAIRFRLLVDAQSLRHPISVKTDNDDKQHIKLNTIAPGKLPLKPPFMGYVDVVEHYEPISLSPYPLEEMRLAIVSTLTAGAHIVVPALCVTGMLGVLIYPFIWRRQQRSEWLFFLAVGAATAVVVRCGIIAYIHVTSWHAINVGYLGPSYPFVIIFAMAGSVILARALHIKHPVRKTFPKFSFFRD